MFWKHYLVYLDLLMDKNKWAKNWFFLKQNNMHHVKVCCQPLFRTPDRFPLVISEPQKLQLFRSFQQFDSVLLRKLKAQEALNWLLTHPVKQQFHPCVAIMSCLSFACYMSTSSLWSSLILRFFSSCGRQKQSEKFDLKFKISHWLQSTCVESYLTSI